MQDFYHEQYNSNNRAWPFEGVFKVSPGIAEWYISSYGTDFDNSDITSPAMTTVMTTVIAL